MVCLKTSCDVSGDSAPYAINDKKKMLNVRVFILPIRLIVNVFEDDNFFLLLFSTFHYFIKNGQTQ